MECAISKVRYFGTIGRPVQPEASKGERKEARVSDKEFYLSF